MPKSHERRRCEIVSTHLEPELKAALSEIAEQDGRTLSNMLRTLADRCVRAQQTQSKLSTAS